MFVAYCFSKLRLILLKMRPFSGICHPFSPPSFENLKCRYSNESWTTWAIDGFLTRLLAEWPASAGLKTAVIYRSKSTSFLQLDQAADLWIEKLLTHHHSGPNIPVNRVAVAMDPSLYLPSVILGILKCGASYLPISTDWTDAFIERVLSHSQPSVVICDDTERFSKLSTITCLDCNNGLPVTENIPKLGSKSSKCSLDPAALFIDDSHRATLYTHGDLTEKIVKNFEILPLTNDEVMLSKTIAVNAPESLLEILSSVLSGRCLYVLPLFVRKDPNKLLDILQDFPVRRLWLHPNYLLRLCNILLKRKEKFAASLRLVTITSPRIPLDMAVQFFQAFSNVKLAVYQRMHNQCDVYENHLDLLKAFYEDTVPPSILLRNFDLPITETQSVSVRKDACGGIYICGKLAGDPALNYIITKTDAGWVQYETTGTVDVKEFLDLFAGIPLSKKPSKDETPKKPIQHNPPAVQTPRPIDYTVEDVDDGNVDDVIEFLVRNTLMVSMSEDVPLPSFGDLQQFTRVILEEAAPKALLFAMRRTNEERTILAVNVAFDAIEKSVKLDNLVSPEVDPKNQALAWTLLPLLAPLLICGGITVESYIMSVDFALDRQQRFQLACQMDMELSRRSQMLGFKHIITKNYDWLSRSVSKVCGYERRASFQLNRLTLPDGTQPFEAHPSSSRLTLNVLILDQDSPVDGDLIAKRAIKKTVDFGTVKM